MSWAHETQQRSHASVPIEETKGMRLQGDIYHTAKMLTNAALKSVQLYILVSLQHLLCYSLKS